MMQEEKVREKPHETRRTFLRSGGALATGLLLGSRDDLRSQGRATQSRETLALNGGPKAVTHPDPGSGNWPRWGAAEEKAVLDVVRKPSYAPNDALEREWKQMFSYPYVKAQCNGTSALAAMFFALRLPPGSEIMVPSYTFFATIVPMRLFGLVPVFVDINPRTLNFDLEDAKKRLTRNTRAMVPVHWVGLPCEMDHICDFAKEKGLLVLEDACHAHGASMKGKYMGNWGVMAAFSFQLSKPLPGVEGGMAVYQNVEYYERGTAFGHYDVPDSFPKESKYRQYFGSGLGLKTRMHPMAAALLRAQLPTLQKRNEAGVAQIRRLNDRLTQLPGLYEQAPRPDMKRIYYSVNCLFIDEKKAGMSREACVKALRAEGVRASAHTYRLQHKLPLYRDKEYWHHLPTIPDLPGCEQANATAIGLPYFTMQVPELVEQYVKAFEKVWARRQELGAS